MMANFAHEVQHEPLESGPNASSPVRRHWVVLWCMIFQHCTSRSVGALRGQFGYRMIASVRNGALSVGERLVCPHSPQLLYDVAKPCMALVFRAQHRNGDAFEHSQGLFTSGPVSQKVKGSEARYMCHQVCLSGTLRQVALSGLFLHHSP